MTHGQRYVAAPQTRIEVPRQKIHLVGGEQMRSVIEQSTSEVDAPGVEHQEQIELQLSREPFPLPSIRLNPEVTDLFDFRYEDFALHGYEAHPHIAAPVAV